MSEERISVQQVQAAIREQGAQWVAADTPVSNLSREEKRLRLGVEPPPEAMSVEQLEQQLRSRARDYQAEEAGSEEGISAPAAYDLRNVGGKNFITPIKNQGGCGSCVAFGTAATVEGTFRVQRNDPNLAVDFSEAHLFYCYAAAAGRNCGTGWWPVEAFNAFAGGGVVDEACFPYTAGNQSCNLCNGWQNRVTKITGQTVLTSKTAEMKTWISTRGPLSTCFIVYEDFFSYKSGIYKHVSGHNVGGHCVSIVGYDDNQKYWICKNSWGTGWGESGFFRIAYGDCGIDTWDVRGANGVQETGWLNNVKIIGLWTINQDRNAYAYVQNTGWRKVSPDNDNIFFDMLTQLTFAKQNGRPVNVYQENGVIKQVYVF